MAIIGGGASSLCAAWRLATASEAQISVFTGGPAWGPGAAYGLATPNDWQLNVPWERMSLGPLGAQELGDWLQQNAGASKASRFLPRALYGRYLSEQAQALAGRVSLHPQAVEHLTRSQGRWQIEGQTFDRVILALGQRIRPLPGTSFDFPPAGLVQEPWQLNEQTLQSLVTLPSLTFVGAGLTMIDGVLSLRQRGYLGTIRVVSPTARGPLAFTQTGNPAPDFVAGDWLGGSPLTLWKRVRAWIAQGVSLQSLVDSLRPHISTIWAAWSVEQQGQYLRHLRRHWERIRHRFPDTYSETWNQVAPQIDWVAGRVTGLSADPKTGEFTLQIQHRGNTRILRSAGVVNAQGPDSSLHNPLLQSLAEAGYLQAHANGLGYVSREPSLELGGPLRRATHYECTALPEIRAWALGLA